jgi:serralysin
MKRTFFSKTIGMLSLLATLTTIVGTGIQRTVQAQSQPPAQPPAEAGAATANLTIVEIVAQSGGEYDDNNQDFDILLNALKENDLVGYLEKIDTNLTVFAPTDEAFLKFSRFFGYGGNDESAVLETINREFAKTNALDVANGGSSPSAFNFMDVLLYHLLPGVQTSASLQRLTGEDRILETLLYNNEIPYPYEDGISRFSGDGGSRISYNGNSIGDLSPNTMDPKLQTGLTDISASNGIIHGIDRVLFPYFFAGRYPISPVPTPQAGQPLTIADLIAQSGEYDDNEQDFDILFKLIQDAGLTDVLSDPNANLTLFAPTDAAFIKLDQLLSGNPGVIYDGSQEDRAYTTVVNVAIAIDQTARQLPSSPYIIGNVAPGLQAALKYHLSAGAKTAAEVQASPSIDTLLEGSVITPKDGKLVDLSPDYTDPQLQAGKINITASNGVIHGIDNVLIPNIFPKQ